MSEPPSEVYFRFTSEIADAFSYGSQHPENVQFRKTLERAAKANGFRLTRLQDITGLREEGIDPLEQPDRLFDYLGLADMESNTGRILAYERLLGKNILSKASSFYKGDVIFGRLRPYLNKAHLVERDSAIGSSELYVVIPDGTKVNPEFLVRYLLSDLTLTQTEWILTGNSYPRLAKGDFLNLSVVIPDAKTGVQDSIVSEVKSIEKDAIRDSEKAAALVEEAYSSVASGLSVIVPTKNEYDYYAVPNGDLSDRLDFNYNIPDYRELYKELGKSPDVLRFGDILDGKRGLTNGVEIRKFVEEGTPYLRVSDVTGNELRLDEVEHIATKLSELTKDIGLEVGNLVISRSGTLGIVLLVDESFPIDDLILSSHLIRVVLKPDIDGRRIRRRIYRLLPAVCNRADANQSGQLRFIRPRSQPSFPFRDENHPPIRADSG